MFIQIINRGAGQIRLANSNYCLDAGVDPRNNIGMKVRHSRASTSDGI
jgi:hypothetical protein